MFIRLKINANRPKKLKIKYFNEEGKENIKELTGYDARIVLHEIDHLMGIPFIDWKISEGNIEIIEEFKNNYETLNTVPSIKMK